MLLTGLLTSEVVAASALILLVLQLPATVILLARLLAAASRQQAIEATNPTPEDLGTVTVVVPTLNEVERIGPCLEGLTQQSYEVREIIIVDSNSIDGTREKVKAAQKQDPRFRLVTDDPLPPGWVGRPWALNYGFLQSSPKSKWILGIDADTQPQPGLVASLIKTATEQGYDLLSLSPQFILKYPGEWWLQPALLITLLYRLPSPGVLSDSPERVMANGQCFLIRRSVLEDLGGYSSAASSFCDDVTLARVAAARGFKVGFFDGAKVIKVRMYEGAKQTWKEWGRSLDLKDASSRLLLLGDLWLLLCTQGLPLINSLFLLIAFAIGLDSFFLKAALGLNLFLVLIRMALLLAIAPSYYRPFSLNAWLFWFSPLADPLAWLRILLSALKKPTQWRGRSYSS